MDKWKDGYFCIDYFRVYMPRAEALNLILVQGNMLEEGQVLNFRKKLRM
jgi:hypothetical protein